MKFEIVRKIRFACLIFISLAAAHGEGWAITNGGLSPDGRLAVAVHPQKTENVDEADGIVLLVDAKRKTVIGLSKKLIPREGRGETRPATSTANGRRIHGCSP